MDWRDEIRSTFSALGRRPDDDVVEEMAQHAEAAWQAARADGAAPDAATTRVRGLIESWCRATDGPKRLARSPLVESAAASTSWLAGLSLDARHALRLFKRQPLFAGVAVLMLAIGVGVTTAILSVVNGVLLKPLPFRDPSRLVRIVEGRENAPVERIPNAFTNGAAMAWLRAPSATIEGIAVWTGQAEETDFGDGPRSLVGAGVNSAFFPILGVQPLLGRTFVDDDVKADAVVVLSYSLWRERFAGADVLGKTVRFDGKPRQIIGVMPPDFVFPAVTTRYWHPYEIVEALQKDASGQNTRISVSIFGAVARLKPGVSPQAAAEEGQARLRASPGMGPAGPAIFGSDGAGTVRATPLLESLTAGVRPAILVMFAAVALLFAAAIGNVANMQLAQGVSRRRELAVRAAIGAGWARLARQLLVETSLVAFTGGAIGVALAWWAMRAMPLILPSDFPRPENIRLDAGVLLAAAFLSGLAAALIGVLPAAFARRTSLVRVIAEDGGSQGTHPLRSAAGLSRAALITAQVAIAAVLLVGASLLGRSFIALVHADRGYEPSNLMTARVSLPRGSMPPDARAAFFDNVATRLRGISSVTHAAYTPSLPLTGSDNLIGFDMPGPNGQNTQVNGYLRAVSRDYVSALGMHVIEGRGFSEQDGRGSEPVMLVNEAFVRAYLRTGALNRVLPAELDNDPKRQWRVIGIVADIHHRSATIPVSPEVYALQEQLTTLPQQYVIARTSGDPAGLASEMRAIVRELAPRAVVDQEMTMDARLLTTLATPRLYALLLGAFASFALLVSGVGLFGVLSYTVSQRTREIGLRTALGATPRNIVSLIAGQGLSVTCIGVAAGLGVASLSSRLLGRFLFGVTTRDAVSFAGVAALLFVVALIACAIPARRAASIDPLKGLRS